ncbi:PrgI family protein [Lentzea sp. JNUCC 0626]|uniref:PrgI family protein n=1 Tax=Lentzea sp. JNUCC 0626 TaxID=3367513 RepID=UPI003749760D
MSQPVRIPADVDREDRVLGSLTARQVAILAVVGLGLYALYSLSRAVVPLPVFLVAALPVAAAGTMLAIGQRDGVSLDRLALAALRHRLRPRRQVATTDPVPDVPGWLPQATETETTGGSAPLRLPAQAVTDAGVIDLGADGVAIIAVCSTINFALRTAAEQEALVASFGRYLHSLTAPVQVLVRAERMDLSSHVSELREQATSLPHPALETAAREFSDYLEQLSRATSLLRRQVLLVLREPVHTSVVDGLGGRSPLARRRSRQVTAAERAAAEARLVRRIGEAADLLGAAGIAVTPLDAGQATNVLAAACNPDRLIPPVLGLAGADDIITTSASDDGWAS